MKKSGLMKARQRRIRCLNTVDMRLGIKLRQSSAVLLLAKLIVNRLPISFFCGIVFISACIVYFPNNFRIVINISTPV